MSASMRTSSSLTPAGTGYVDVSANGHPHVLGLRAVDEVAEDPAAAAQALPVATLAAEAARSARGDARDEDPIAGLDVLDAGARPPRPCRRPRGRGSVPSVTSGTSPFRMCRSVPQIVTASTRTIASVDSTSVGRANLFPCLLAGTVVDEGSHDASWCVRCGCTWQGTGRGPTPPRADGHLLDATGRRTGGRA